MRKELPNIPTEERYHAFDTHVGSCLPIERKDYQLGAVRQVCSPDGE